MERFRDQTVVVTGASRGLGRALAVGFGREGAHVVVGYRARADEALETRHEVEAAGGGCTTLAFDVRDRAAVDGAVAQVLAERGRVDVLVNNAGVARDALFAMMPADDWSEMVDVNLTGAFHCARAVVRPMLARRAGAIVNVASSAALRAAPGQAGYAASKGGLLALTRALAGELGPRGVRVNAVVPGYLTTGMAARLDRRLAEEARARIPLGRFGAPDDVVRAVLFLASDEAAYIVGQALVVDGGLTL